MNWIAFNARSAIHWIQHSWIHYIIYLYKFQYITIKKPPISAVFDILICVIFCRCCCNRRKFMIFVKRIEILESCVVRICFCNYNSVGLHCKTRYVGAYFIRCLAAFVIICCCPESDTLPGLKRQLLINISNCSRIFRSCSGRRLWHSCLRSSGTP